MLPVSKDISDFLPVISQQRSSTSKHFENPPVELTGSGEQGGPCHLKQSKKEEEKN